jgi:hypothetical protein
VNLKNLSWENGIVFTVIVALTVYAAFNPSLKAVIATAIGALSGLLVQSPVAPTDQLVTKTTRYDLRMRAKALQPNREDKSS